jgi:hypothetical protein
MITDLDDLSAHLLAYVIDKSIISLLFQDKCTNLNRAQNNFRLKRVYWNLCVLFTKPSNEV